VLKLLLCTEAVVANATVQQVQANESKMQSGGHLAKVAQELGFMDMVDVPSGTDRYAVKVASNTVEALVGCVSLWRSFSDAAKVASLFGLVTSPTKFSRVPAKSVGFDPILKEKPWQPIKVSSSFRKERNSGLVNADEKGKAVAIRSVGVIGDPVRKESVQDSGVLTEKEKAMIRMFRSMNVE